MYPTVCSFSCLNDNYDDAVFHSWGDEAEKEKLTGLDGYLYIEKLREKLEYLYSVESDIKKELFESKDRLYFKAIKIYIKRLLHDIFLSHVYSEALKLFTHCIFPKIVYVFSYPSDWSPGLVNYFKSLLELRPLKMYSEGASLLRYIQEPHNHIKIKKGYKYLTCDVGGSGVELNFYEIRDPLDEKSDMLLGRRIDWDVNYMKDLSKISLGIREIKFKLETFLLSLLSTPSKKLTQIDLERNGPLFTEKGKFAELVVEIFEECIKNVSRKSIKSNKPYICATPFHYQPAEIFVLKQASLDYGKTGGIFVENQDEVKLSIMPSQLEENVLIPICEKITQYLRNIILSGAYDSIEGVILTGGFCTSAYLTTLIKEMCGRENIKLLFEDRESRFTGCNVAHGAILKSIDQFKRYNPAPIIVNKSFIKEPANFPNHFLHLVCKSGIIQVSYTTVSDVQQLTTSEIKHIANWPGQSRLEINFPTVEVMIIPYNQAIISLKNNVKHHRQVFERSRKSVDNDTYFTFEKEGKTLFLIAHQKASNENLLFEEKENNLLSTISDFLGYCLSANDKHQSQAQLNYAGYIEKRVELTLSHFFNIYLKYVIVFLGKYFKSTMLEQIGPFDVNNMNFCIQSSQNENFPKSVYLDKDYDFNGLNVINPNFICPSEAFDIYCGKMAHISAVKDGSTHINFLKVLLYRNECIITFNRSPSLNNEEKRLLHQDYVAVNKHEKIQKILFSVMDTTCENLWLYIQKKQINALKRCTRHESSTRYFSSRNMQIFKEMLHKYISTALLNVERTEKSHMIRVCNDSNHNYCQIVLNNSDIMEYGIIPAFNRLACAIRKRVSHQLSDQKLHLNAVFVAGKFLDCRDNYSYLFLEKLLLSKLREYNLGHVNNTAQLRGNNDATVKNLSVWKQSQEQIGSIELSPIFRPLFIGSLIHTFNLGGWFGRSVDRDFAIRIQILDRKNCVINEINSKRSEAVYMTHHGEKVFSNKTIFVVRSNTDSEFKKVFEGAFSINLHLFHFEPTQKIVIDLVTSVGWSLITKGKLKPTMKNGWSHKFLVEDITHPTYPIVFKAQFSQTDPYQFWVEYDKIKKTNPFSVRFQQELHIIQNTGTRTKEDFLST